MTKTAAIYARQSVTTAGDKDVSIDDQIARCRALPAVAACDAVEVYIDRNRSGQDATREAFQKMLGRIESGELTVVAAYDDSRIRRENEIGARFMNLLIAQAGTQVVFADGSRFDTTPDGELEWTMKGAFARKQARDSGIRLSNAHKSRQEQGHATGTPPYGYRYERQTAGEKWPQMVADEETAPVLQRLFQTYAEGEATATQIARMLHDEKVPAPISNRNKNRADRAWTADVIGGMLANRRYIAEAPAKWKGLVERDVFDRVQQRLKSKAQGKAKGQRSCIFVGLLYCQECGRRLSPSYFPKDVYYVCQSKNGPMKPCGLARESVKESDLRWQVEAVFADFLNGIPAATPAAIVETNEMWERIEVRLDEPTEDERLTGDVTRRDKKMARVVKLLARADRASQAHALVTAALQYVRGGMPVLFDSDGKPVNAGHGPGADTLAWRGWMGIEPTQDASAAPRKRF